MTWRMPTVPARQRAEGGLTGTRPLGAEDADTAPAGKRGQRFKRAEGKEMLPALARLAEKGPLIHMQKFQGAESCLNSVSGNLAI